MDPRTKRIILYSLGVVASGGVIAIGLITTGTIESERGSGGGLLMDTFTTTGTKSDFVRGIIEAAQRVDDTLSLQSRLMLAAWAAHESGWGKGTKQVKVFNLWNLTAGSAWLSANKPIMPGNDTEFTPGAAGSKKITQNWRAYGSLDESVADLFQFLKNGYMNYKEALTKLVAGDPAFATSLGVNELAGGVIQRVDNRPGTAGFYTAPRSGYQRGVDKLTTEASALAATMQLSGLALR